MNGFDFDSCFAETLQNLRREGRYRVFADLERDSHSGVHAYDHRTGRRVTVWCSNDYLAMGAHPDVIRAAGAALERYGAGAGGTRNISGTTHEHVLLEGELADLHRKESALLFTSGYVANDAALSSLGRFLPGCVIFSDELNHASMIEGIRHSGADKRIFRHNDWRDLERQIASVCKYRPKIICFESCYSMDGDFAPMEAICDVARRHGAFTYVDEVHAVGLYGARGAGVAERDGLLDRIDMFQGTLSKGFGAIGGYIAGSRDAVDFVRSHAPGFIFSTALPPSVVSGIRAALDQLKEDGSARAALARRAASLKAKMLANGIPVLPSPSHILPVMIGDAALAKAITDRLMAEDGIYIQPINYPTVPRGTERLRITPTPLHTDEDEDTLIAALVSARGAFPRWTELTAAAQPDIHVSMRENADAIS
ncbi:MAG: 5-aminolevulinate synthase [Phenylobacterium sp.]|uniref:5-aminolevulinate synthase n=1 Tax=Phenylobacterium sp. TaxID=1871053 RepID=UPI0017DAF790|nr:5-aminolevulinate synthase [Phenylobacterium sp.]MBA4792703.1 5-aminolevulinate synthase [Phenylobacterium sp.]